MGKLAEVLQPFVDRRALAGAVALVANADKVLAVETVGFADIAAKKPMRADTMFWIASQSKPITGAALMILVDEGKVNVEDPVEKYLPEFKDQMLIAVKDEHFTVLKKPDHPIKVREVLSHTSGLAFCTPMESPTLDALALRDSVRSHAIMPLQFPPGTKYQYSNGGTNTAGRIIEVASGMPYEDFLDERLFKPLGMKDTTFWPNEEQLSRLAKAYKPTDDKTNMVELLIGQLRYPLWDRSRHPIPAGGLFSTANDCARFCQMVLNGGTFGGRRYISEASIKRMIARETAPTLAENYGLGWATDADGSYGHGGAFATNMKINPARKLVTVWLIQHAGFPNDGDKAHGAFLQTALSQFA